MSTPTASNRWPPGLTYHDDGAEDRPGAAVRTEVERRGRELHVLVHRPRTAAGLDGAIAVHAHRALRDAGVDVPSISIACAD